MNNEELYRTNVRALSKRYPDYADLVSAELERGDYVVETRGSTVLCRDAHGRWIHGPDDPGRIAIRDAEELAKMSPRLYIVVRPGLGYQAIALLEALGRVEPGSVVLVVEDRLELWKAGLRVFDWSGVLRSELSVLLLGDPYTVVESFLERHPGLTLLPMLLVAPPEIAVDPECQQLVQRLTELSARLRDALESRLGAARSVIGKRRAQAEPLRVVLAGDFGYLSRPVASAFMACACDVVADPGSPRLPRNVRALNWLLKIEEHVPDVVLWLNLPDVAAPVSHAMRSLGIANVWWSVDSPRWMALAQHELECVDLHVCFDGTYLIGDAHVARSSAQLSVALGIDPLPGCSVSDEIWPERSGPDLTFVGALGEGRMRQSREILILRHPETLELLDRLSRESDDPARDYEQSTGRPLEGALRVYVDELRSKHRRLEILSALADLGLRIYGDADWYAEGGVIASCYAGRRVEYGFDLSSIYYHSKINLNVFHAQCVDSTNSRVYDVLSAGGFLLTEYRPCLEREFEVGRHLATFETAAEAREKVAYFSSHPEQREMIAREGQRHVLRHHTFEHRCGRLLDLVRAYVPQSVASG